eukprot:gnl/MRDRNA2_/MRDRNA2_32817_c0_seq1.p1 gnl/MRDRNA2_/MRDRNA2_32817_c0~~gnl/MRDRNA2_/MRDRNA2_32817_c0_seq1.p1  ORF type:complete len:578 (-),score=111.31 gnl/MRDRNA2_/MRDRNA2_32817_c0_seq1:10-1743(-)
MRGSRGEPPSRQSWPQRSMAAQGPGRAPVQGAGSRRSPGVARGLADEPASSTRGHMRGVTASGGQVSDLASERTAPLDNLRLGELDHTTSTVKDRTSTDSTFSGVASWGRLERMRVGIAGKLAQLEEEVVQLQQPLKEPGGSGADAAAGSCRLAHLERLEKGLEEQCIQASALQECHAELIEKHRIASEQLSSARAELRGATGKPAAECAALAHCRAALALLCVATGSLGSATGVGVSGDATPQTQPPGEAQGTPTPLGVSSILTGAAPEVTQAIGALVDEASNTKIPALCLDVQKALQAFELRVFGRASAIKFDTHLQGQNQITEDTVQPSVPDVETQTAAELEERLRTLQQEKEGIDQLLTQLLPLLTSSSAHVLGVTRLVEQTCAMREKTPAQPIIRHHPGADQNYGRPGSPVLVTPRSPTPSRASPRTPRWQSPQVMSKSVSSELIPSRQNESPRFMVKSVSSVQLSPRAMSPPPGPVVSSSNMSSTTPGAPLSIESSSPQRGWSSPAFTAGPVVSPNAVPQPKRTSSPAPPAQTGSAPSSQAPSVPHPPSRQTSAVVVNCSVPGQIMQGSVR